MISLVGCTGFVGENIARAGKFEGLYHSSNIEEAYGTKPDLLIYAGLRAEKFLAEKFPEKDLASIHEAEENIKRIAPLKPVLISTIDVYEDPFHATEETSAKGQGAYGRNRAQMEEWIKENYSDYLIVRLPGLFGTGIKKNFIYDYIHYIPALLNEAKFAELSGKNESLKEYYALNEKGFYQCRALSDTERTEVRKIFEQLGFSALNFTDSRGIFQYYNLEHLYRDIFVALDNNIKILNIMTEPVTVCEIYKHLTGESFLNELGKEPPHYDARSLYYPAFSGFAAEDGTGGYLYSKKQVLDEIKRFVDKETQI